MANSCSELAVDCNGNCKIACGDDFICPTVTLGGGSVVYTNTCAATPIIVTTVEPSSNPTTQPTNHAINATAVSDNNNCTDGFEVVITVDTTSSLSDTDREQQVQALMFIISQFWEVIGTKAEENDENAYDLLKFALITFGRNVRLHFGLNNSFTTLGNYLNATMTAFSNDVVYEDDTNTVGALIESVEIFEQSENTDLLPNTSWTRVQILFTGKVNQI